MNRSELIKQSRLFEEKSAPDDVYPMALAWVRIHPSWSDKIPGIAALLAIWNGNNYWDAAESLRHGLDREDIQTHLNALKEWRLSTCNFEDCRPTIVTLWTAFRREQGFGPTAVSKALHMLIPDLFVPWDGPIANTYHRGHGRVHENRSVRCYFEFLLEMQEECKNCLSEVNEEDLALRLGEICGYSKPIAKAIDEANYNLAPR